MKRSVSRIKNALWAVGLGICFAGCDSSGSEPEPDVIGARALPDTSVFTDDAPVVVDLSTFFASSAGNEILFDARLEGESVEIERVYDKLTITPATGGVSTIYLTADSPTAAPVEAFFRVHVQCATSREAGKIRYFPTEEGTTWRYDYLLQDFRVMNWKNLEISGNLIWTVTRQIETCRNTEFLIQERFGGGRSEWIQGHPRIDPPEPESWDRLLRARVIGDSLYVDRYTDGTIPYLTALPWSAPAEGPDAVVVDERVDCGDNVCPTIGYSLAKDAGLSRFSYRDVAGGLYTITFTLKP